MTPGDTSVPALGAGVSAARPILSADGFGLRELRSASGLVFQLLPNGAIHAIRHGPILLNQFRPGPAAEGLFRLLLRRHDGGRIAGWTALAGPGLGFGCDDSTAAWQSESDGLRTTASLTLHPKLSAWAWRIRIENRARESRRCDVLLAQDLGLGETGGVRNNEAYASQYLDLCPLHDAQFGHVVCARQNLAVTGGRHPWLAVACAGGAEAFCTDGWQFFGRDHRLTGEPAAVRAPSLPSRRLQYEFALAGLQSRMLDLASGGSAEVVFIARFVENHPGSTTPGDLALVREAAAGFRTAAGASDAPRSALRAPHSIFTGAPWLHGARPAAADWAAWFPGARRHEERSPDGQLLSFFHGEATHVVSRDKEALVDRPHGHILRSGDARGFADNDFGVTCHAAGVFGAQAYLGNPSLARLLSVVRNPLGLARACGQRVFVKREGEWRQLGVPSVFAMEPDGVRWIYRLDDGRLELRAWCSATLPAGFLQAQVTGGRPCEFLVTHQLALGANEFDSGGRLLSDAHDGWLGLVPAPDGFLGAHLPGHCFAIAVANPADAAALGGDELIHADGGECDSLNGVARGGPYAVVRTRAVSGFAVILAGCTDGAEALAGSVAAARAEYAAASPPARILPSSVRLRAGRDPAIARMDEILPWFTHNAAIHFSAPHGLEQHGGGAWGVRDVTQGSLEWLLADGEFPVVRRMLRTVFAQQYAADGGWPQWFMFPPFAAIQQAHSHGDVCFWPVKALCDYVEASGDFAFLDEPVGYTDPVKFTPAGAGENLWAHCDRVVAHCEARFVPGTALVNYGDGDWDDTLQPADPAMRTRMISAWTVALAWQTFAQLAKVARRAGEPARADRLDSMLARMRADFARLLMPDGVVAGFLVAEPDGSFRPLLHPKDRVTGIRHRLLPMTRAVIAGLFTPAEARRHMEIVETELRFPDGVRLMSEPVPYHGGVERLFRRADTAANVGREIGLQYVHAHLRYAEAMARLGDAERLWWALQVVNPVALAEIVPSAAPRQSNVYFSSSDADFPDRHEAVARWAELRSGAVPVRAGWRLYSSGPGLFLHKVRACLLGVRESFGDVVFDPVLPRSLDGLVAETTVCGRPVELRFRVHAAGAAPSRLVVNGLVLAADRRETNPYRPGGVLVPRPALLSALRDAGNVIEMDL